MVNNNLETKVALNAQKIGDLQAQAIKTRELIENIQDINTNVAELSGEIKGLVLAIHNQNERIIDFKKSMDRLERIINDKIDDNQTKTEASFSDLAQKIEALEKRQDDMENTPYKERFHKWNESKQKILIGIATSIGIAILTALGALIVAAIRSGIIG